MGFFFFMPYKTPFLLLSQNEFWVSFSFSFFSCICKSVDDRPDTVELASQIADKLLVHVDNLRINQITLEKKLEKERKKAQRYCFGIKAKYTHIISHSNIWRKMMKW